jgi:uncharacterized coiled-coil DUF342 family protein
MTNVDIDDLVREARDLREKLAVTAAKLDAFTEALQQNVDRLREISTEMTDQITEAAEVADDPAPAP